VRVVGVVLAAGAGERFGSIKQLAQFRERPLLEWPLQALRGAGLERVAVVLGAHANEIERRVDLAGVEVVHCPDWASGQAASLRAAVAAASDADALVVVLGDQPLIAAQAVRRVVAAADGVLPVRAVYNGVAAHPTLLPRTVWNAIADLDGDQGARELIAAVGSIRVPCDGLGSADDADTPQQLAELDAR
jgi:molybdenum cofactor cytidylyltransferase